VQDSAEQQQRLVDLLRLSAAITLSIALTFAVMALVGGYWQLGVAAGASACGTIGCAVAVRLARRGKLQTAVLSAAVAVAVLTLIDAVVIPSTATARPDGGRGGVLCVAVPRATRASAFRTRRTSSRCCA